MRIILYFSQQLCRNLHRHIQHHLRHAFAQRVVAQRAHAAAAQGLFADEVDGVDAGQIEPCDFAFDEVSEPSGDSFLGDGGFDVGQKGGLAGDDADVGGVAFVAAAGVGELDEGDGDCVAFQIPFGLSLSKLL